MRDYLIKRILLAIGVIFAIVGVPFFIWCARREAMGLE